MFGHLDYKTLELFEYLKWKHNSNCPEKFTRRTKLIATERFRLLEILIIPRGLEKVNFSPKRPTNLCVPLTSFRVKVTND